MAAVTDSCSDASRGLSCEWISSTVTSSENCHLPRLALTLLSSSQDVNVVDASMTACSDAGVSHPTPRFVSFSNPAVENRSRNTTRSAESVPAANSVLKRPQSAANSAAVWAPLNSVSRAAVIVPAMASPSASSSFCSAPSAPARSHGASAAVGSITRSGLSTAPFTREPILSKFTSLETSAAASSRGMV